ncbi:MAG: hypothetical protein HYW49_12190 [Deltaproteobacteria bacterium]|nr:hypothetical protein [Deltaproteobacteria bacterium]
MNSKKLPILISVALALVLFLWNSQKHPGVEDFNEGTGRNPSSEHSSYDVLLKKLSLRVTRANLHAHHFMGGNPPKGQESSAAFYGPGACPSYRGFPEDDGRPCRDDDTGTDRFITAPFPESVSTEEERMLSYFRAACDYAREKGKLDALFISMHTKSGDDPDTDTKLEGFQKRQKLLKEINRAYGGKFFCGLAQEASSISSGNHVNIFGHLSQELETPKVRPFYFAPGDFNALYSQLSDRAKGGEKIVLQMNHPNVKSDLWWGSLAGKKAKDVKELLNDYGLDDFAPVGCIIKSALAALGKDVKAPQGCDSVRATEITGALLKETLAKVREAAGDRFRLIEVVSPGGATENPEEKFRPVHRRAETGDEAPSGVYDWVFYLANGFKLAPAANQDNHHFNYGTATASRTGLLLDASAGLNEKSILDALDSRRTFASEDVNAEGFSYAVDRVEPSKAHLMGEEFATSSAEVMLRVGYKDPDVNDAEASIRVYHASDKDEFDFGYKADRGKTLRALPIGANGSDSAAIRSDKVASIKVPVAKGSQWLFVEISQKNDLDRLWLAPVWITR